MVTEDRKVIVDRGGGGGGGGSSWSTSADRPGDGRLRKSEATCDMSRNGILE